MNNEYGIEKYEELFEELSSIKNDLINPNIKLADAIYKVKRGKQLYAILNSILDKAEEEVEKITDINTNTIENKNICEQYDINSLEDTNFEIPNSFDINSLDIDPYELPF
ncbi:MAG: exodeoxyribonuclease VII small subunit [Clostridium sp.]|nr:exodeoxyribonuclease VII small subunit [Clostridium sp.]